MSKQGWVIGATLLAMGAGVTGYFWPSHSATMPVASSAVEPEHTMPANLPTPPAKAWVPPLLTAETYQSPLGPLPLSLRGTSIPMHLQVDAQGRLTVTPTLRNLFDYFLKTEGEEPYDTIFARIREILGTYLPMPARERALGVFEQYLALKQQEIELNKQWAEDYQASGRELDLAERLRLVRELRASLLDAETYEAFYGSEDARENFHLKARELARDTTLTPESRDAALSALENELPAEERNIRQEQRATDTLNQRVIEARASGASDADIFRLREAVYGAEAAQRFAAADQQQGEWQQRIDAYRNQRQEILATPGLSDADKRRQIDALRTEHFDEQEQKRIPVIDSMMDEPGI
jgi:lipase chaperone LimK